MKHGVYLTVFEIKGTICQFFSTNRTFNTLLIGFSLEFCKQRSKNCEDMSLRLHTVSALVRQTNGRTDGRNW